MKYIQFEFATGRKTILPMRTKKNIKEYLEKYAYVDGGICNYQEVKKEDACIFTWYNQYYKNKTIQ